MIRPLAALIAGYALLLGLWALAHALTRRGGHSPRLTCGLILLEALLLAQALAAGIAVAAGHRPDRPAVFAGYLATTVLLLPLPLLATTPRHGPAGPALRGAWTTVAFGLASLLTAYLITRTWTTWQPR